MLFVDSIPVSFSIVIVFGKVIESVCSHDALDSCCFLHATSHIHCLYLVNFCLRKNYIILMSFDVFLYYTDCHQPVFRCDRVTVHALACRNKPHSSVSGSCKFALSIVRSARILGFSAIPLHVYNFHNYNTFSLILPTKCFFKVLQFLN